MARGISVTFTSQATMGQRWSCDPGLCERMGSLCCRRYRVSIWEEERNFIEEMIPSVFELFGIPDGEPVFDLGDEGFTEIQHSAKRGGCVFLTYDHQGVPFCALHRTSVLVGLDYRRIKPRACRIFPLEIIEETEDAITVALHKDAEALPCLGTFARSGGVRLDKLVRDQLHVDLVGL